MASCYWAIVGIHLKGSPENLLLQFKLKASEGPILRICFKVEYALLESLQMIQMHITHGTILWPHGLKTPWKRSDGKAVAFIEMGLSNLPPIQQAFHSFIHSYNKCALGTYTMLTTDYTKLIKTAVPAHGTYQYTWKTH